jgi:lysophospholipid acyltransferase (LPLAT)-like uncharacterized protein
METHRLGWTERLAVALALPLLHLLGATLRIREEGRRDLGPRSRPNPPVLWALWHETILLGTWHHRHRGVHVMISASRDGELIARVAKGLGYTPVRGSSSRGGREAAQELVEAVKAGSNAAITPDGPRGPRRTCQPGVVKIAKLSRRPVVPFGFAAERCWRLRSWDRFILPKPFSRCVFVYGEPVAVDPGGDDAVHLKRVQDELDRVTAAAEDFFGGGAGRAG